MTNHQPKMIASLTTDQCLDWFCMGKEVRPTVILQRERTVDKNKSDIEGSLQGSPKIKEAIEDELSDNEVEVPCGDKKIKTYDTGAYQHCDYMSTCGNDLPIFKYKDFILSEIATNKVTIIQGTTGCGKSTQVPKYILQQYAKNHKSCNIIVTQPTRVATVTVANRVSEELKCPIGSVVGYQVGLDKRISGETRVRYVTVELLLNIIISKKNLNQFSHIILDEVHERSIHIDLLLMLIKKLLGTNSPNVKVILMSATLNCSHFLKYFSEIGSIPSLIIVQEKMFNVQQNFYEDLKVFGEINNFSIDNPIIGISRYKLAANLIEYLNGKDDTISYQKKTILVFLPGISEINRMAEHITVLNIKHLKIIRLHSLTQFEKKLEVFQPPNANIRKVILSTNIAESSITVPDVKYVIDFCLMKRKVMNYDSTFESLELCWSSRSNSVQRLGRAGRVADGLSFHLVPKSFWKNTMSECSKPEMQFCCLANSILHLKQFNVGSPRRLLSQALSPPHITHIAKSVMLLKEVGALSSDKKQLDGHLTVFGEILCCLKLDIYLGKLIMMGYVFGCIEDCIIIAATIMTKGFFVSVLSKNHDAAKNMIKWSKGSLSDCIMALNVYKIWKIKWIDHKRGKIPHQDIQRWCKKNFVNLNRLKEVELQINDIKQKLNAVNICTFTNVGEDEDSSLVLKIAIAATFYPNYFLQQKIFEKDVYNANNGLDPFKTVMLRSLPFNESHLYKKSLIEAASLYGEVERIYYDSSKAIIEFKQLCNHDSTLPAVYHALSNNQRIDLTSSLMDRSPSSGLLYDQVSIDKLKPNILDSYDLIPIRITFIESCTTFWGVAANPQSLKLQMKIEQLIKKQLKVASKFNPSSRLYLAPYDKDQYYRAIVLEVEPIASVFLVDIGKTVSLPSLDMLVSLSDELKVIPYQAIKFQLCKVHPVGNRNISKRFVIQQVGRLETVKVKIFSYVFGVYRVELFTEDQRCLNTILIEQDMCEFVEEGEYSKQSHENFNFIHQSEPSSMWTKNVDRQLYFTYPRSITASCFSSTLETPFVPMMTKPSFHRNVNIMKCSINSHYLCTDFTNSNQVLMVASDIRLTDTSFNCLETTVLPALPALPSLVSLLFAPKVQLTLSSDQKAYRGALCGLGTFKDQPDSMLFQRDIKLFFDRKIMREDIDECNEIRKLMNELVNDLKYESGQQNVEKRQQAMREMLISFIYKKREKVEDEKVFEGLCSWMKPDLKDEATFSSWYSFHKHVSLSS